MPSDRTTETCEACSPERLLRGSFCYYRTDKKWFCDLGYNIGTEKNNMRPVLVMSNNKINNSEKVVVVCITDAKGWMRTEDVLVL